MKFNVMRVLLVLLIGLIGYGYSANDFFDWNRSRQEQLAAKRQAFAPLPATGASNNINLRISDVISGNVLRFAQNIGQQLSATSNNNEIFSPISVMSALALLLLGAKGKSYQELQRLFGADYDEELLNYPNRLHEQLSLMLNDLQQDDVRNISPVRGVDAWRHTEPTQNIRNRRRGSNNAPSEQIIKIANGVFTQIGYTLNPDYSEVIKSIYKSKLSQLDFKRNSAQSRSYINDWVNHSTYGKIPSIIDGQIERGTNVIMASALYFKAFWENDFFGSATKIDDFYIDGVGQPPIKVSLMATGGTYPYYNASEYGCQILGMPYRGNLTTMYVIQPYQSSRSNLRQMQRFLDANKIEDMISHMTRRSALVVFPKMRLTRSLSMKNVLQKLNIRDIFSEQKSDLSLIGTDGPLSSLPHALPTRLENDAVVSSNVPETTTSSSGPLDRYGDPGFIFSRGDFEGNAVSSMQRLDADRLKPTVGVSDLYVEDIVHKVDFDVNEQGTEAAAATVTYLKKSGPEVVFRADAPFMLLVRHDPTKLILFYGIINEPPAAPLNSASTF